MREFILKYYEEFKQFMDLNSVIMPSINPIEEKTNNNENGKTPFAYINADEIKMPTVDLYYSPNLFLYSEVFQKSKLFHEFTHILDANLIPIDFSYDEFRAIMATYSEYHASQIELACNIGFRNIHSFHKINLSKTFVINESKKIKIETDYLHPMADSLVIIEKDSNAYFNLSDYEYYLNYSVFEAKTMYYLGKKNFCAKYSITKNVDITDKSYGIFTPYIRRIEKLILEKEFSNLYQARKSLWNQYLNSFPYIHQELLPKEP